MATPTSTPARASTPDGADTRGRILDAAERLFTKRGYQGTSLRAVTSAADVNLAAVHYHIGSKEALLHAVAGRRIAPINRERLRRLDLLEAQGAKGPTLEQLLEAFLEPALAGNDSSDLRGLLGTIYGEPPDLVRPLLEDLFAEVAHRFEAAFQRALPDRTPAQVSWGVQLAIGSLTHVVGGNHELAPARDFMAQSEEERRAQMVRFLAAGMRA